MFAFRENEMHEIIDNVCVFNYGTNHFSKEHINNSQRCDNDRVSVTNVIP